MNKHVVVPLPFSYTNKCFNTELCMSRVNKKFIRNINTDNAHKKFKRNYVSFKRPFAK